MDKSSYDWASLDHRGKLANKMIISKILFAIFKRLATFALNWIYNFVDMDKDGVIEKEEVEALTNKIQEIIKSKVKTNAKD